jgi:hypothetical protein
MQTVTQSPQPADVTQPSPRARPVWPWWSIASLLILVILGVACGGVALAYAMRPAQVAVWPTAVLVTVTDQPERPVATLATATPAPQPWTNLTRAVRVKGTQGLSLRVRSAPSTQADTIKLVPDGTRLIITGDGQQAEGMEWWPVRDPSDNTQGWAVSAYLVPDAGQ